jgi:hypothetical protein
MSLSDKYCVDDRIEEGFFKEDVKKAVTELYNMCLGSRFHPEVCLDIIEIFGKELVELNKTAETKLEELHK